MSVITVIPTSNETLGDAVRRWSAWGYALSNHRGRVVAVPMTTNVVPLRKAYAPVVEVEFDYTGREQR
jgi:hypothetical protein